MGQSVLVICPERALLASLVPALRTVATEHGEGVSDLGREWQSVVRDSRWKLVVRELPDRAGAIEEFSSNEDLSDEMRAAVPSSIFVSVAFDDVDVMRRWLRLAAEGALRDGDEVWFDMDYGWAISAQDLLREVERAPEWDWRG